MSLQLPDGATFSIATALDVAKAISAISNADPAVASSAAHGYGNGDLVVMASGWGRLNDTVRRVENQASGTFQIGGLDATDTNRYPALSGVGSAKKITTWTQILQVTDLQTSGGEQQYATEKFLEEDSERQVPTFTSARSLEIVIADDDSLAGYIAVKKASEKGVAVPFKLQFKSGSMVLYYGIPSLNETPTVNAGEAMKVNLAIAVQGTPVRYRPLV